MRMVAVAPPCRISKGLSEAGQNNRTGVAKRGSSGETVRSSWACRDITKYQGTPSFVYSGTIAFYSTIARE